MSEFERQFPPRAAAEKETLTAFLDAQRAIILMKIEGVSDDDLRRKLTPSGLSLLGLVKHLAYVERSWFQAVFAGRDIGFPWTKSDPDADWRIEPDETTKAILELYNNEVQQAREIVAAARLEDVAQSPRKGETLRWILMHMIEETARHAGHADILRETIDGTTGE